MRCKHDVHGTDCVICFPTHKAQGVREWWINCCIAFDNYEHLQTSIKTWHKKLHGAETVHVIEHSAYQAAIERAERAEKNTLECQQIMSDKIFELTTEKMRSQRLVEAIKQVHHGHVWADSDCILCAATKAYEKGE